MNYLTRKDGYAIYRTQNIVQLASCQIFNPKATLICHCVNYQSAMRIAKAIATEQKLQLIIGSNHSIVESNLRSFDRYGL